MSDDEKLVSIFESFGEWKERYQVLERGRLDPDSYFPGRTWGPWSYERPQVLVIRDNAGRWLYEVDLERCRTAAAILDWIAQVAAKQWEPAPASRAEVIGYLVLALDEVIEIQANVPGVSFAG